MQTSSKKLIVVLGPTSSGKSDYAIRLAREVDGEIISVDSRQVYRGMDIGTGKVTRDPISCHPERSEGSRTYSERADTYEIPFFTRNDKHFYSEGIRHHLLDVASPKREYNVTHFLRDAKKAIADIEKRGKIPILTGGTAFWAEALLLGTSFPEVKPNKTLRTKLGKFPAEILFGMLQGEDPERAATIDANNKIRLIRALEIVASLGKVPSLCHPEPPVSVIPSVVEGSPLPMKDFSTRGLARNGIRVIVLNPPKEILHARIEKRLKERLEKGMIEEVKRLREEGVSWKRLEGFGLEYRWCARFLQGKISHDDLVTGLLSDIRHYAKRQLTLLRRLERKGLEIEWKR